MPAQETLIKSASRDTNNFYKIPFSPGGLGFEQSDEVSIGLTMASTVPNPTGLCTQCYIISNANAVRTFTKSSAEAPDTPGLYDAMLWAVVQCKNWSR